MTVTEAALEKQAAKVRRDEELRRKDYAVLVDMIRAGNSGGVSYDRIAKSTRLSKTQVQRICGA